MMKLKYSLIIETPIKNNDLYGYFVPNLHGFTGIASSIEECLCKINTEIDEHIEFLKQDEITIPEIEEHPTIVIVEEGQDWKTRLMELLAA